jgi:branched-chain amino acid transport system permease protein
MNIDQFLNMIFGGSVVFLVASGLGVIFGLMRVINFAHGAFIMVGAYGAYQATKQGWSPWLGIPAGIVVGAVVGFVVELVFMRRLYGRPWDDTVFATLGLSMALIAGVSIAFGREIQFVGTPLPSVIELGSVDVPAYRVYLLGLAIALFVVLWVVAQRTTLGLIARAVIANESLAATLGVNTKRVRRCTFVLGAALAGLAGAAVAPIGSVQPTMGADYLVVAFMVVLVAGSSLVSLGVVSFLYGAAESFVTFHVSPIVGNITLIVLTVAIMKFRRSSLEEGTVQHAPVPAAPGGMTAMRALNPAMSGGSDYVDGR